MSLTSRHGPLGHSHGPLVHRHGPLGHRHKPPGYRHGPHGPLGVKVIRTNSECKNREEKPYSVKLCH